MNNGVFRTRTKECKGIWFLEVSRIRHLLGFELVQLVDLFAHLGDGIVVLLSEVGEGAFVLDIGFLQVPSELGQFGFTLLIQFDLGRSGSTRFLQTLAEFLEFPGEVCSLLFGLKRETWSSVSAAFRRKPYQEVVP